MIQNEDFMGPEFSLTIKGLNPNEFLALRQSTEQKEFSKSLMTKICSKLEGFLFTSSLPTGSFYCEQESDPSGTFYNEDSPAHYVLFCSINVCYEAEKYDQVSSIIYSDAFETFLIENTISVFFEMTKDSCSFLTKKHLTVEIDGIGET
jgi:hypothetical protein